MKRSLKVLFMAGCCVALASLLCLPALASSKDDNRQKLVHYADVIYSGIDLWVTPDNGLTYSDFSDDPIPAGFFCQGSEAFTGLLAFKGGGLNTVPAGILGDADTIIYRMDDAVFDQDGVATTRVKFMALSLVSIEPIQTECGQFHAAIRLKGEQPVTSMRIERTDLDSGIYSATLAVKAKVTFTPLGGDASRTLELDQKVQFVPSRSVWTREPVTNAPAAKNFARVDVDGDGQAETAIPGPSNFRPGFIVKDGALARATFQEVARAVSPSPCPVQSAAASSASSATPFTRICPEGCHCSPNLNWGDPVPPECWQTTNCEHCHCPWGSDPR